MDEELRRYLDKIRTDIMARIDRLQDALTLEREEKIVDQGAVLLMRRQIQHLQDRVQALEEKNGGLR